MTIDEQIAVLQAYKDGKTIEVLSFDEETNEDKWMVVPPFEDYQFNFRTSVYRIKPKPPEPKYRPYTRKELWEELRCKRDNWLTKKSNGNSVIIREFDDYFIWIGNFELGSPYDSIMENYTWPDGTPFGVKEE